MGYIIETYTLSELNKISTPGRVVPALFWMIPVGEWDSNELEKLWDLFTKKISKCNELGLMLVKNYNNRNLERDTIQNSNLTGKLIDLLPSGISSIYDNDYLSNKKRKNQILVLSGCYPQPGWGILISLNKYWDIEKLLENSINKIEGNVYSVFINASKNFKNWEVSKRAKPFKDDIEVLKNKKLKCVEFCDVLNSLLSDFSAENVNNYIDVFKKIRKEESLNEFIEALDSFLKNIDDKFILSILIIKSSKIIRENDINSTLIRFVSEHNPKTNNLFKIEGSEQLKKVAGLLLKLDDTEMPKEKFVSWAKSIY
jgi:hypothetical protein